LRFLVLLFLLFVAIATRGQQVDGVVTDDGGKPLFAAGVTNMTTQMATYTDQDGRFRLPAKGGDLLRFTYVGYKTVTNMTPATLTLNEMKVALTLQNYTLDDVTVHPDYTPYQLDSIKRRKEYAKELDKKPVKPKFVATGTGIGVDGLIGSLVQKASKSEKKRKKFLKEYKQSEESRYIDLRYTPEVVSSLTGYKDDSLALFMNAYPMNYQFARAASNLELKMWIRYNYRAYVGTDSVKVKK
jgi:hypothetical protein